MITADHPYAIADGYYPDGIPANGWHGIGRFSDFDVEEDTDGSFVFSWTISSISIGYAVFIFRNGEYLERTTANSWIYRPQANQSRWLFEFAILPNESNYEDESFFATKNLKDSLRLTYDINGEVERVEIYKNTTGELTIDYTATPLSTFRYPVVTVEGTTSATVAGSWPKNIEKAADITVTITYAGTTGTAQFQWTWGSLSGPVMTTQTYYQLIELNGLRLKFTSGASWTIGQTFTIAVQMKETYDTGDLENGYHRFGVVTYNSNGFPTYATEVAYTLSAVPASPTIATSLITYVDGSGEVTCWWRIPDDPGVDTVWVYRNWPADGMDAGDWNFPLVKATVSPGQYYDFEVTNLQAGLNQIWARCGNNGEREENLIKSRYDLLLDSSLNMVSSPNPPISVEAEVQADGTITITVHADSSSDTLNVYHDSGTGTVSYASAYTTITNPQASENQTLTKEDLYLADGTYKIGVRAEVDGVEETNTDTITLYVSTALAAAATGLALELID